MLSFNWGFFSTIIIILALLLILRWAQKAAVSSKELALIATLAALAALGRVPFAAVPSVQPTTFLVIVSGFVFGPQAGFMVGATSALVSNFFLGQGPWTPWQMIGWGLVGLGSAYLYRLRPHISPLGLAIFGALWGFLFGWIQDLGFWLIFVYPLSLNTLIAASVSSIAFDAAHAAGNFLLCLFFAAVVIRILREYKERLEISYVCRQKTRKDIFNSKEKEKN